MCREKLLACRSYSVSISQFFARRITNNFALLKWKRVKLWTTWELSVKRFYRFLEITRHGYRRVVAKSLLLSFFRSMMMRLGNYRHLMELRGFWRVHRCDYRIDRLALEITSNPSEKTRTIIWFVSSTYYKSLWRWNFVANALHRC